MQVVGTLSRRRQGRHPLSHASRNEASERRAFSRAAPATTKKRATRRLPDVWQRGLDRLVRKHETARRAVPAPVDRRERGSAIAILAYGTTHHAVVEARERLREAGIEVDYMRVRALPLSPEVASFIAAARTRLRRRAESRRAALRHLAHRAADAFDSADSNPIRHYNGVPIDAHAIIDPLLEAERQPAVVAE